MQLQVTNSPFSQEQIELLNRLLPTLAESQKTWLSGYLAAPQAQAMVPGDVLQDHPEVATSSENAVPTLTKEVTILFGSHTGNGQLLSDEYSRKLEEQGFQVTLSSMGDFKPKNLKKVENLLVVVSTHGEGDPPDDALPFYEFLHGRKAPKLENQNYAVLALGDSSYEFFCQTGKDFDKRLEELGGKRLYPRVDCDLDFDEPAEEWFQGVLSSLTEAQGEISVSTGASAQVQAVGLPTDVPTYSRTNPFRAEILENLNLNGRGSNKETRHLELSLEGSNLEFEPGDSLGIYPENDSALVDMLIDEMNWNAEESVPVNKQGEIRSLREALKSHYEITVLTKPLLEKASTFTSNSALQELLEGDGGKLRDYLTGRDLLDFMRDFAPWEGSVSEFLSILRKLPARLYSIASSSSANPDEVHLTIGAVRYDAHGRARTGVCSGQCAERTEPGDFLPIYIQRNPNFKLPAEPDTPIIMIGPGTGIAPFRSFMEEREEIEAEGKSWLFFGDQHFTTDFLYQVDWQRWLQEGVLTHMDVAFSRDTEEKVYVQHRMLEKSEELYQWLEEGAVVYICGDEKRMAHDVHTALTAILEKEGAMSQQEAEAYLSQMQQQKRYQRDVY
ncbi:assimilatory sulfite reductase (NADPH) flavoprotein subunit [Shouchella shacheensis]|uniref:assimilatory sulfite reductase (NADPH) flavoprotein subunit n=1 Tax=Shouchella shacheensis TaxID=1649580 RepID=UPI00073FD1B7|nr:assimilatory sulfite reductase (NADPH) flavoprotein subunit [Shouchella shacheensis]